MTTKTKEPPRLLTAAEIISAEDREFEYVEVHEWGGTVKVIALTGTERGQYEASMSTFRPNGRGGLEMQAQASNVALGKVRLVAMSIVDEANKRLFSDADVLALGDKSAPALERVNDVAMRLSRFTAGDVEALKQGLKVDQNGSSGSE